MIVSLGGKPGSGKSTIGTKLASCLGYKRYYIGAMRREEARKRGMSLAEYNKLGEKSDETDRVYDELVEKLGKEEDNFVIESRTAFLFIPHSIKIFLDVSTEEGAKRIWQALSEGTQENRNEADNIDHYEDMVQRVRDRLKSDAFRYQKYYKIDVFDEKHYDLYLDTTNLKIDEVFEQVYSFVKKQQIASEG